MQHIDLETWPRREHFKNFITRLQYTIPLWAVEGQEIDRNIKGSNIPGPVVH